MTPIAAMVIGLSAIALAVSSLIETNQTLLNAIVLATAIVYLCSTDSIARNLPLTSCFSQSDQRAKASRKCFVRSLTR